MTQLDISKKILDHFILACEIDECMREKNVAVRNQDFELAVIWRDREVVLRKELLSFEDLKNLREQLNLIP